MKKVFLLLIVLASAAGASAQVEFKSGLILNTAHTSIYDGSVISPNWAEQFSVKHNYGLGYKFRLTPTGKRFFTDIDVLAGYKQLSYFYIPDFWLNYSDGSVMRPSATFQTKTNYFQFSVNPTFNYKVYDGWYVGAGVEPSIYLVQDPENSKKNFTKFDMPITGRIGYDFKYLDVAVSYKYGLFNVFDPERFTSGKFKGLQLSVFVPF